MNTRGLLWNPQGMTTSFGRSRVKSHIYSPSSLPVNVAVLVGGLAPVAELKIRGLPIVGDQRVDETSTKINFSMAFTI